MARLRDAQLLTEVSPQVIAACQQFRARKLSNCTVLLFAHTRPVVESSSNVRFGCYSFGYRELKAQLDATGLSPLCNPWSQVHARADNSRGPGGPTEPLRTLPRTPWILSR